MKIEDIELSDAANAMIVQSCGYKCFQEHLPETPNQTIAALVELQKAGLVGYDGLDTKKAHEYVENALFLADAFDRHG